LLKKLIVILDIQVRLWFLFKKIKFLYGNKITTVIFKNHYLIIKRFGIIILAVLVTEFKNQLINYEDKDKSIIQF